MDELSKQSPSSPSPSAQARQAVPRPPGGAAAERVRAKAEFDREKRTCTDKRRFDSDVEALLAAQNRMLTVANKHLSVYACDYCAGFHLTSATWISKNAVAAPVPVLRTSIAMARPGERRKARQRSMRKRDSQERVRTPKRQRDSRGGEEFYRMFEAPRVASPEVVEEFFRTYGKPGLVPEQ